MTTVNFITVYEEMLNIVKDNMSKRNENFLILITVYMIWYEKSMSVSHLLITLYIYIRERVVLYRQHIRTKEYQMSLVEEHLRTCGNSKFQIFPFFKLRSMDKINRETHESIYIKQLKPALNRKN